MEKARMKEHEDKGREYLTIQLGLSAEVMKLYILPQMNSD